MYLSGSTSSIFKHYLNPCDYLFNKENLQVICCSTSEFLSTLIIHHLQRFLHVLNPNALAQFFAIIQNSNERKFYSEPILIWKLETLPQIASVFLFTGVLFHPRWPSSGAQTLLPLSWYIFSEDISSAMPTPLVRIPGN